MTAYRPWRIAHVHLDRTPPELPEDPRIGGIYVVYWWRDLPLGLDRVATGELPISAREVRERGLATIAPVVAHGLQTRQSASYPSSRGGTTTKDVTIAAPVVLPDGQTVQKTLVVTLRRANGENGGRWLVTGVRDAAASQPAPRL